MFVLGVMFFIAAERAPSPERLRALADPFGLAAPLAFLVLSTGLHASFVPGPLLAGASGLLFGPVLGTAVTLSGSVCSALVELTVGRRGGREGIDRLGGERYRAVASWLDETASGRS